MDLGQIWREIVEWIHLVQNRNELAGSYKHCDEISGFVRGDEFLD
jgi:hypothetical protein